MPRSIARTLWIDPDRMRYFLIPDSQALPPGSLLLQALNGTERSVDAAAVARFAVPEAQARTHLRAALAPALQQAGSLLSGLFDIIKELEKPGSVAPGPVAGSSTPADTTFFSALLGSDMQALAADPAAVQALLLQLLNDLQSVLNGPDTPQPDQLAELRTRLQSLRTVLQERGVAVSVDLDTLPDRLFAWRQFVQRLQPADLLTHLEALSAQPNDDTADLGKRIDALIASLDQQFGALFGQEDRATREARQRQEYRESAQAAIARSLRAHNITPRATRDDQTDT